MLSVIHILSVEKLSKGYSTQNLFKDINFSIDSEEKIGLIGINGTGKSTLLKIIVGLEFQDSGQITTKKRIRINYLAQEPTFDPELTVLEQVFNGDSDDIAIIRDYESCSLKLEKNPQDEFLQNQFNALSLVMTSKQLYDLEHQIKSILQALGLNQYDAKMQTLSGGQKKRVALAEALVTPCDLLVLDEPTNHLDSESIYWLESFLRNRNGALLMITHDRYFLDRIVTKTIELYNGSLYEYMGNYEYYVEKKAERMEMQSSIEQKKQNLYKKELAWMRAGVQARSTKSKSRIQRFKLIENSLDNARDQALTIEVGYTRLGSKIIDIKDLSKSYDQNILFEHFEYQFATGDRIGIVGANGVGKSTLINIITGTLEPSSGLVDIGQTVKFGYFTQEFEDFSAPEMRAIEYIRQIAEYVTTPSGNKISASELMETFLFSSDLQWTPIAKLSGGEQRRLQLLSVLIEAPNVIVLDEPTNNLDLDTLKVFEQYLDGFQGVVLCVSHDRYFLDRVCDKLFAFENDKIDILTTSYSDYIESYNERQLTTKTSADSENVKNKIDRVKTKKEKLTFKEIKALEELPHKIDALEEALYQLDTELLAHATDFVKLTALTQKKADLESELIDLMEQLESLQEKESLTQ